MADKFAKFKQNSASRESLADGVADGEVKSRGDRSHSSGNDKIEEAKAKVKAAKQKAEKAEKSKKPGSAPKNSVKEGGRPASEGSAETAPPPPPKKKKKKKKASTAFKGVDKMESVHRELHQDILDLTDEHHKARKAHQQKMDEIKKIRETKDFDTDRVKWVKEKAWGIAKDKEWLEDFCVDLGVDLEDIIELNRDFLEHFEYKIKKLKGGTRIKLPWQRTAEQGSGELEKALLKHGHSHIYKPEEKLLLDLDHELEKTLGRYEKEKERAAHHSHHVEIPHDESHLKILKCCCGLCFHCLYQRARKSYITTYACWNGMNARLMLHHKEDEPGYADVLHFLGFDDADMSYVVGSFTRADKDKSGQIDVEEFITAIQWGGHQSMIAKIFGIFDVDGSGECDFYEWAFAVWNFSTCHLNHLTEMMFDLYSNHEGVMHHEHIEDLIVDMYGYGYMNDEVATKMKKHLVNLAGNHTDTGIDVLTFVEHCKHEDKQIMAHPVQIQEHIRFNVVGPKLWRKMGTRRYEKFYEMDYKAIFDTMLKFLRKLQGAVKGKVVEEPESEEDDESHDSSERRRNPRRDRNRARSRSRSRSKEDLRPGTTGSKGSKSKEREIFERDERPFCRCRSNCLSGACPCFDNGYDCDQRCGCGIYISCCNCDAPRFDRDGNPIQTELYCWDVDAEETLTGDVSLQLFDSYNHLKQNEQKRLVDFIRGLNGTYVEEKKHKGGDSLITRFSALQTEETQESSDQIWGDYGDRCFADLNLMSKVAKRNIERRAEKRRYNKRMGIGRKVFESGKRSLDDESAGGKSALTKQLELRKANETDWAIVRKEVTLAEFCKANTVDIDHFTFINTEFFEKHDFNPETMKLKRGWRLQLPKAEFDMYGSTSLEEDQYVHKDDEVSAADDGSVASSQRSGKSRPDDAMVPLLPLAGAEEDEPEGDEVGALVLPTRPSTKERPSTKDRREGTMEKPFTPGGSYRPFSSGGTFRPLPTGGGEVVETFLMSPAASELASAMPYDLAKDELFQVDLDIVANVSKAACEKNVWRQLPVYEKLILMYPAMSRRYRERARIGDHRVKVREAVEEVAKYFDVKWASSWGEVKKVMYNRNWSATRKFEWFEYQIKSRTVACNRVYHTKYYQEDKLDKKTKEIVREAGANNGVEVDIVWDPNIKGQSYREGGGVSWEKRFYRQGYAVDVERLLNPTTKKDIKMKEKMLAGKKKFVRKFKKIQRRCELKQMRHMRKMLWYMIRVENSFNGWIEMTETDEMLRNQFIKPDIQGEQVRIPEFEELPEELLRWKDKEFRVVPGSLQFVRLLAPDEMSPDQEVDIVTEVRDSDPNAEEAEFEDGFELGDDEGPRLEGIEEIDSDEEGDDGEGDAEADLEKQRGTRDWSAALNKFEQLNDSWTEKSAGPSEEKRARKRAESAGSTEVEDFQVLPLAPERSLVSDLTLPSTESLEFGESLDAEPSQLTLESWEQR